MPNMQSSHEIRALCESDVPRLCALAREIWRAHYPGIISEAQIEYMLNERYTEAVIGEELKRGDVWWDVLLVDGTMTGYASYFWTDAPGTIKIDKLYFHLRVQRQGYGGMLMDHVTRKMAAQGCKRLTLAVNRNNQTAIAAYLKNGFQIAETSPKQIGGGFWMDDYIMVKTVNG
jgi:ribosomal protein S18 acetylase RimI-like enzyme